MVKCKVMTEATISSKHQIVIPREAREALGVKAGDKVNIVVRGENVLIVQKPKSHQEALLGLAHKKFPKDYLSKERQSWK